LALVKEASQKFDGVVQVLQRNTQPVPLSCRQLFELLAALASLAMMSFDQVGGSIDNTSQYYCVTSSSARVARLKRDSMGILASA
jgi:hypothetical protein